MEQEPEQDRFPAFLQRKNIDAAAFSASEPELFRRWADLFAQVHEESFVMQQKFHLNPLRRRFPLVRHQALHSKSE
jgi:hypothetical protein